jgi:hypothetical protein
LKVQKEAKKLEEERRSIFHTYVRKAMFLCKRAQPDIDQAIAFLSSRVKDANEGYWNTLLRVLSFLKGTINDVLKLEAYDTSTLMWHIDAAFAVHADMKSHTGAVFTMGKGAVISSSTKQKVNSHSFTESELIGVDDKIAKILWTKRFLKCAWKNCMCCLNNWGTLKWTCDGHTNSLVFLDLEISITRYTRLHFATYQAPKSSSLIMGGGARLISNKQPGTENLLGTCRYYNKLVE